jgi:hypothetical protein
MMMRRGVGRAIAVGLVTALVSASGPSRGAITIGSGPWIGMDTAGHVYFEEFQDWTSAGCWVWGRRGACRTSPPALPRASGGGSLGSGHGWA